jgi:hypothetical protein
MGPTGRNKLCVVRIGLRHELFFLLQLQLVSESTSHEGARARDRDFGTGDKGPTGPLGPMESEISRAVR